MGAWDTSITANDTARDLLMEYQVAFCYNDVETAVKKLDDYVKEMFDESDKEEWCNYRYSLADFMWKKGRLTEEIKGQAITMIESGFGLEIWEESGKSILNKRKNALIKLREKLLSPQPDEKKIRLSWHTEPVFRNGDVIAIKLDTHDKIFVGHAPISEDVFRRMDGKYVIIRKLYDNISRKSSLDENIKNIWPVFQLYNGIFDEIPDMVTIKKLDFAITKKGYMHNPEGIFGAEGNMNYFKRRKYIVIDNYQFELEKYHATHNERPFFDLGLSAYFYNVDEQLINSMTNLAY